MLLQSETSALDDRISESRGVRNAGGISLGACQQNRVQANRLTPQRRSWLMSRVRGKNTTPEIRTRKIAHALGLRFRIHRQDLPGKPDIVFPRRRLALFVHGCFWHRHPGCRKATAPSSKFWATKFSRNIRRDALVATELKALGWRVAVI